MASVLSAPSVSSAHINVAAEMTLHMFPGRNVCVGCVRNPRKLSGMRNPNWVTLRRRAFSSESAENSTSRMGGGELFEGMEERVEMGGDGRDVGVGLGDASFRRQVAVAVDASAALEVIAERAKGGGVVGNRELVLEALALGNGDLAFSVLQAMRSSVVQRRVDQNEKGSYAEGWRWKQPNVGTYATLVRGLAASSRVADAIEVVADVRRRGVPAGDEVPFSKVVSCLTCTTALAVVQPQEGVQVAPCAKCWYQYELMSVDCELESISMNISVIERGLRLLKLLNRPPPAAVHSIVVRAPDGLARTHRCATESADIPAQEGERVTVISAAPADVGRRIGSFNSTSRTPGWRPSEPVAVANHVTGRVSLPAAVHSIVSGVVETYRIGRTWTRLGFLRSKREGAVVYCRSLIDSGSSAGTTSEDKAPDGERDGNVEDGSILTGDGSEMRNTVRLVECAMLAATAGLAYFLSNLLRLEAYFGCFFPLPVVISSMRWGAAAGRKTMVATAMLLLILSGPLKASSYLLMHGFVGLAMGAFWKWNLNWGLSIVGCTVVRCLGALGFVLLTSWLLRDNLLALITMNAHASLSFMLAALGINFVPSMPMIYVVFASLLVVNCGSFVFLLHVLYAIFLRRLGLRCSYSVPGWVERAMSF